MLYGALAGDIIGSRFEFINIKTKTFELFHPYCKYTDDSVMTLAVYEACKKLKTNGYEIYEQAAQYFIDSLQEWGREYPGAGYGSAFCGWIFRDNPKPYNSWGNGSAMRVSAVGWMFDTLEEVEKVAKLSAEITHNHPEGIKGAVTTAGCIFLARTGHSKKEIKKYIKQKGYKLRPNTLVRPTYEFNESCQGTVPVALESFLESTDFEDAIREAVSMGGDSDTIAAITGSIAEAFYGGVPEDIKQEIDKCLDTRMLCVVKECN